MGKRNLQYRLISGLVAVLACAPVFATDLFVEIGQTRAPGDVFDLTDAAVRQFASRTAELTVRQRSLYDKGVVFSLPIRVVLTQNGEPLPMSPSGRAPAGDITLSFVQADGRPDFPAAYKVLLEDVFASSRPVMNIVFGEPAVAGEILVSNYDADIQDRYAVAGGYYVPNGPNGQEIRFPVYLSGASASVNFVHTLLLAYQGLDPFPFDVVSEGLVRAATMRVVRTPNALPASVDAEVIENTLLNTYDNSAFYDWYNQPALGGPTFVAPNLLDVDLPAGGSTGGIFLNRYMMAGTAWSKILTEHPGFIAEFNAQYRLNPASYTSMEDFALLGESTLATLVGGPTGTVEGHSITDWMERQFIMDTGVTAGLKVMVAPFPLTPLIIEDFGPFGLFVNAFRTDADGNESLLAGTGYPIYWRPDFIRFFTTVQDDELKFAGAFAAVAPNFPEATFGGDPYRVAVDVPFGGINTRVYLPAGAIHTGGGVGPNNFYGTLTGLDVLTAGSYEISVEWSGGSEIGIPVQNFAFGVNITDSSFDIGRPLTVRVFENDGVNLTELFSRKVNKGPGQIALDLRPPEAHATFDFTNPGRLSLMGLPLQPYRQRPNEVFDLDENQTLFAEWNPITARYDLFPDAGQVTIGKGFFHRAPAQALLSVSGVVSPKTPIAISLQPGWNAFSVPFAETVGTGDIFVTYATASIAPYNQAVGTTLGTTVFEFSPDPSNADQGTMIPTVTFEPGKSYFIRALRAEGAVLIVHPNPPSTVPPAGRTGPVFALGKPEQTGWLYRDRMWESQIEIIDSSYARSVVVLGQSTEATRGFDPGFDSPLPPSPGGMQLAIRNGAFLFRDIRIWGDRDRFEVVARGLDIGERCTIKIKPLTGSKSITILDLTTGKKHRFAGRGSFKFIATEQTHRFEVLTGDAR